MFEEGAVLRDTAIAFTVVSPLFVAVRFACRLSNRGLGWDDWTLVPGLVRPDAPIANPYRTSVHTVIRSLVLS